MHPLSETWTRKPTQAGVCDYLCGGRDNFEADRELAGVMLAACPELRELARANRAFVLNATRWCASMMGISQYIDCGCGLPLQPSVHHAARDGCPEATVVYVDNDPMAVSHASAIHSGPGLGAVLADASDPATVLKAADMLGLLDPARPACVIFGGTLSAMDAATARKAVAAYAEGMAPGSAIIVSCLSCADEGFGERMARLYSAAGRWFNHSRDDVARFLLAAGLRIVWDRVADVKCWPMLPSETPGIAVVGGVGIVKEGRE